jgi:hypothetical protein
MARMTAIPFASNAAAVRATRFSVAGAAYSRPSAPAGSGWTSNIGRSPTLPERTCDRNYIEYNRYSGNGIPMFSLVVDPLSDELVASAIC